MKRLAMYLGRSHIRSWVHALAKPVHARLRGRKIDLFLRCVPAGAKTLLDIGGGYGIDGEFERLYARFSQVTVVNLLSPPIQEHSVDVRFVLADGCDLPFADGAFDCVFSNAVIEHVGGWERQRKFASEVRRVAACAYCVASPNRYFPIEPHTLLPFYQFYPPRLRAAAVRLSPGYLRNVEEIDLLSGRQMRNLFPGATIYRTGFTTSIVAIATEKNFQARAMRTGASSQPS